VLVPRERVAHVLRRELLGTGRAHALAGTRFVPTPLAAVRVLRAAGIVFEPGEEVRRPARLLALFRAALRLDYFPLELLRSKAGWNDAFSRTISDLEGAGLRPYDLDAAGDSGRLRDVASIWRALDESAGRSWTVERICLEAAAALEQRSECWPFQGAVLACASGNLTAAQARFLRAIPQATIGIPAARPVRRHYLDRIKALLGVEAADALAAAQAPRIGRSERDIVSSYLFEPPVVLADPNRPRSKGPDGTVDLEEHAGVEEELEATADWVARQILDGTPLEEIAVLTPAADPIAGLVADRLGRLPWHDGTLPVYIAGGFPLTRFTAGARALAVVRTLRAHLAADALANVLPALRLSGGEERHLSRGAAMSLLWSLGTVGGNPAHPRGALEWSARAVEREAELQDQLALAQEAEATGDTGAARRSDLERLIGDLRAIRPALQALIKVGRAAIEGATLSALWPALRGFFEEWILQPVDGPRVHVVLDDTVGGIAADGGCGSLAGDDALRIVEEAILAAHVPAGRFGDPAVYVGAVRDAVGLSFTAVRVIGLAEGRLPSAPREDPVIPDAIRKNLWRALVPTAADRALEDLHALDAIVRNAERRLAFSAPRFDAERSQREPSSAILEAAAALGRPNRATGEANAVIPDRAALQRDSFVPAREHVARFRRELPLAEAAWQDGVARSSFGIPRRWFGSRALDLDRIGRLAADPTAVDGLLGAPVADLPMPGLAPDRPISPSGVEELLKCPHAFLLGQILRFEEAIAPPPRRKIGQPAYGLLFHAVAAEFYACNGAAFCRREGRLGDWIALSERAVDRAFEDFLKGYPLVGQAVRGQQRERLRRDVRELLEYDWTAAKGTTFVASEKVFGRPTPVTLGSFHLRGRIDRIDIENGRALIRDLKTGRAHPRFGKQAGPDPELDVQIALYGLVAGQLAGDWNIPERIAAAYAYFGRGGGSERSFRQDFHEALQPAAGTWLEVAARLLTERLFPRTPHKDDCTYCPFRPVCGDGAQDRAAALLAGADGVLTDFAALKGVGANEENS